MARQFVWWPGLGSDIAAFIAECDTCIKQASVKHQYIHFKQASVKHQSIQLSVLPNLPWEEVAVDVFVLAGKLFLVIVDYYTRWFEAPPISA